jgi:MFS family permease
MRFNYGSNFWLMSLSMFFFMMSFNLIMPELNGFLTALGSSELKGLIITLFTISAGISRPFSGKIADLVGRKTSIYIGIIICILVSLTYPIAQSLLFFFVLRFLHGFSAGFMPTGATALVTDVLPEKSRGQAMGIWGTFISLGIGLGQALGSWIFMRSNYTVLFGFSGFICLISLVLATFVKETLKEKQPFKLRVLRIQWKDVVEPTVFPAAVVMFLTAASSGIIFVITPDISNFLGINNKGWFFGIYVISTILIRLFSGSLSDRIGRRKTLLIGNLFLITAMLLIGLSTSINSYTFAAIIFGCATGISSPTLFAWTADLSDVTRRGVGAGTMFIALECGIMLGSLSTLFLYDSTLNTILNSFIFGALLALTASIYLIWHLLNRKSLF